MQQLKTITLRIHSNRDARTVAWGRLEGILTRVVSAWRQFIASGVGEFEGFAIRALERVREGVEGERASKGHGGDDVGGGDERMCGRVGVITSSEVTVV